MSQPATARLPIVPRAEMMVVPFGTRRVELPFRPASVIFFSVSVTKTLPWGERRLPRTTGSAHLRTRRSRSRQALDRNIEHVATHLEPVRQALLAHVKAGPVVHMDETPVRVQAPGKGKCDTGYFWVLSRDERNWNADAQPAVVFEYAPSRAGSVAAGLLSGTSIEYLQTDSYGGYNRLFAEGNANDGIRSVKCWAHARRKFKEAADTQKSPLAKRIISLLKKVYGVERQIKGLTSIERAGKRHKHSLPILQSITAELTQYKDDAQGKVKTAIEYTLKAFERACSTSSSTIG